MTRKASLRVVVVVVALGFYPSLGRAADPVEKLKDAIVKERLELIAKTIPELRSIAQLRRAYFLADWSGNREGEVDPKLEPLRKKVGDRLTDAVNSAADDAIKDQNIDRLIALAQTIAAMAENEKPAERGPSGKFASRFAPLLIGPKGLANSNDLFVRQCGLDALGKITPKPAEARPVLKAALTGTELGPRRIAAFALCDLVKNAHYLDRADEMDTVADAVTAATSRLSDEDESIRGYCLQTIHAAGKLFTDYPRSTDTAIHIEKDRMVLDKNVSKILQAFQDANPFLATALQGDSSVNIRLAALETLSQIVIARTKILDKLNDQYEKAPDKRPSRNAMFQAFGAPDPVAKLLDGGWEVVPGLLRKEEDVRLRRGAMSLLEMVAEDVEQAVAAKDLNKEKSLHMRRRFVDLITPALVDSDRFVRWTAARTMRQVSVDLISEEIVMGLGHMLIDPVSRDPDLSGIAAATLENIAGSKYAPRAIRFLKSAITDREKDVEIREAAMRTLVAINTDEANDAIPELTSVLTDTDVRIRRLASATLGTVSSPRTRQIADDTTAALKLALRDDDAQVRQNAAEAILSVVTPRQ